MFVFVYFVGTDLLINEPIEYECERIYTDSLAWKQQQQNHDKLTN